jgi:hypothetical protein
MRRLPIERKTSSGSASSLSSARPRWLKRSALGHGQPCAISAGGCGSRAWCGARPGAGGNARSRSPRTRGSGSHTSGMRLRRASSASTYASMRSVLQASGASALRVGEAHIPTGELELTVDKAGAVHHLDHGEHRRGAFSSAIYPPSTLVLEAALRVVLHRARYPPGIRVIKAPVRAPKARAHAERPPTRNRPQDVYPALQRASAAPGTRPAAASQRAAAKRGPKQCRTSSTLIVSAGVICSAG